MTLYGVFEEFCDDTTAHGFHRLGDRKRSTWARFMWLIVLIGFISFFLYQMQLLVRRYLIYETNINMEVSIENSLPFPSITLCNINPFRQSNLPKKSALYNYTQLIQSTTNMLDSKTFIKICTKDKDPITELFCGSLDDNSLNNLLYPRTTQATTAQEPRQTTIIQSNFTSPQINVPKPVPQLLRFENKAARDVGILAAAGNHTYDGAIQPINALIRDCLFSTEACKNYFDYVPVSNPWFGMCYRLNPNGKYVTVRPGPLYGLILEVYVEAAHYMPSTAVMGVKVKVHEPGKMGFPEIDGIFAPVGEATAIAVTSTQINRLGDPYGKCVRNSDHLTTDQYNYKGNYTLTGCQMTCLQSRIVAKCGCWYFAYNRPSTGRSQLCATVNETTCATKQEMSIYEIDHDCVCHPSCNEIEYKLTISHGIWPIPMTDVVKKCANNDSVCQEKNSLINLRKDQTTNELKLQIYYDTMTTYSYTQTAAYPVESLVSDFGGQFGLCMGASFCTIVEIWSLFFSLVAACFGYKGRDLEKDTLANKNEEIKVINQGYLNDYRNEQIKKARVHFLPSRNDIYPYAINNMIDPVVSDK